MEGTPKTVTLSHEADGWYAIISCAEVPTQPLMPTGRETGIDVGLQVFLITADGEVVENPRHYRQGREAAGESTTAGEPPQEGEPASPQSGEATGSGRTRRWKRQRADFHHKTALALFRDYDTIYLEDLRVANQVRNHHLAKSIADAGWARFRGILEAKAACAGRRVVAVPPAYTSQECSGCGERVPKTLSMRTHNCPTCGLVLDRDENAARTSNGPDRPFGDSRDNPRG